MFTIAVISFSLETEEGFCLKQSSEGVPFTFPNKISSKGGTKALGNAGIVHPEDENK